MDIIRSSYYIFAPWCDEINFCCFICVTQSQALHVVIKRQFFTFVFAVFQSQSIAEILLLLPLLDNKQMPYGNSTSGFDFELFIAIGMSFCTDVTNFIRIGRSLRELWGYVDFPRWRPYRGKSTLAFWFYDVSPSGRQRTVCIPNFDQISQSTAEILLLPVAENKRPPYLNSTPGFDFDLFAVIGMWFCTDLSNFMQIGRSPTELWCHIDFTRWRPWRRKSTSGFWFGYVWHLGRSMSAYQISTRYLNPRLRYYCFRFLKTNGRHLETVLPVSILTFSLPSACDSALAYQILCKSDDRRRSNDVISILQDGGWTHENIQH